ncbi:MAG: L-threonylcarbamoyladenylate synthase [Candidatus Phytoplasma cynodontis]|uniref:L-threonylcarbamoyladenylate synthase n=1 Tax='Cynodon dactylon' phytoplasma TaxID=295320 RepID=UPI001265B5A1|nr:L-threonylcarbamoyladenylate synthase ['Cynodon dactylon' phytoplasma]KAB8122079.1 threonylcarbamoyl-AMP synthase ['Cynodon dactylon' phytoplasma]WIA07504.1 MAG: L-threonylcarbamoyladenylate synthase [Candidatus Phytoplasma cynodontis]
MKKRIIIFPTDTVYGIATKISDTDSLNKIYQIKKRNLDKPITVLFSSLKEIQKIVLINDKILKIANFFWPGPLTLIVPVNPSCFIFEREKKIGIRIPNHKLALKILKKEGPLRTTSVNFSGQPALNNYYEIKKKYQNKVDYIYYDNKKNFSSGISSTVFDIVNFKIIRMGDTNVFQKLKKFISDNFD